MKQNLNKVYRRVSPSGTQVGPFLRYVEKFEDPLIRNLHKFVGIVAPFNRYAFPMNTVIEIPTAQILLQDATFMRVWDRKQWIIQHPKCKSWDKAIDCELVWIQCLTRRVRLLAKINYAFQDVRLGERIIQLEIGDILLEEER